MVLLLIAAITKRTQIPFSIVTYSCSGSNSGFNISSFINFSYCRSM